MIKGLIVEYCGNALKCHYNELTALRGRLNELEQRQEKIIYLLLLDDREVYRNYRHKKFQDLDFIEALFFKKRYKVEVGVAYIVPDSEFIVRGIDYIGDFMEDKGIIKGKCENCDKTNMQIETT